MTAQLLSGKAYSEQYLERVKSVVSARGLHRAPALAVILVGDNPASQVYVRNKMKACEKVGITSIEKRLPASTSEAELLTLLKALNEDDTVDGILVQLPLPSGLNATSIIDAIDPKKDVDGFHVQSAGALLNGRPGYKACTPYGVMKLLESTGVELTGKHAVVVGRSTIVGKPQALMLLDKNCTVTIAHSKTPHLSDITRQADVLVVAVGRAKMVTGSMIKPGAIVIDVGMNRDENGKLCGDVDTQSCMNQASWITPVPGGVGPMTIAMLIRNTLASYDQKFPGVIDFTSIS